MENMATMAATLLPKQSVKLETPKLHSEIFIYSVQCICFKYSMWLMLERD